MIRLTETQVNTILIGQVKASFKISGVTPDPSTMPIIKKTVFLK